MGKIKGSEQVIKKSIEKYEGFLSLRFLSVGCSLLALSMLGLSRVAVAKEHKDKEKVIASGEVMTKEQTKVPAQKGSLNIIDRTLANLLDDNLKSQPIQIKNCSYNSSSTKGPQRTGLSLGQCLFFNQKDKEGSKHPDTETIFPGLMTGELFHKDEKIANVNIKWKPSSGVITLIFRLFLFRFDRADVLSFGPSDTSEYPDKFELSLTEVNSEKVYDWLNEMGWLPNLNQAQVTDTIKNYATDDFKTFSAKGEILSRRSDKKNVTEFELNVRLNFGDQVECESSGISNLNPFTHDHRSVKENLACGPAGMDAALLEELRSKITLEKPADETLK